MKKMICVLGIADRNRNWMWRDKEMVYDGGCRREKGVCGFMVNKIVEKNLNFNDLEAKGDAEKDANSKMQKMMQN
jgi:hypothetical protein